LDLEEFYNSLDPEPDINIWCIQVRSYSGIGLWRTAPEFFRVIIDGEYTPVLSNPTYFIVDEKFEPVFSKVKQDQLTIQRITIRDHQYNTEANNYIELKIVNELEYNADLKATDSSGLKVWRYGGYIFVSGDLKEELSKIPGNELWFSQGFFGFAG
jgi:hypothetical protein